MNYMDHHSWLVENNLLTDEMKDNVAMAAWCVVEEVVDASTTIDFNNKEVNYAIIVPDHLYNNLKLLEKFENREDDVGFFEMMRLKKFLKKKKNNDESGMGYNLTDIADKFVKSYLTEDWSANVEVFSAAENNAAEDLLQHGTVDMQSD